MKAEMDIKKCEFGAEIPAYLYNEIAEKARLTFESHLAGCESCIDEFADLSEARFSVLEWQRAEFADLPTPSIVIPYEAAPDTAASSGGWVDAFLDLIRVPVWSYAGAFAAVLLAIIAGGYFLTSGSNKQVAEVSSPAADPAPSASLPVIERSNSDESFPKVPPVRKDRVATIRAINVRSVTKAAPRSRALTAVMTRPSDKAVPSLDQAVRKPALSTFDDDDDSSLRLADLFDDGGV